MIGHVSNCWVSTLVFDRCWSQTKILNTDIDIGLAFSFTPFIFRFHSSGVSFGMLDWRASSHKIAFQQAHVSFSHSKFAIIDCNIACLSLPQPRFCNDTYTQISCKVISSNRLLNSDLHNEYLCYGGSSKIVSDMDRLISLTELWLFLLPNILITSRHYYR